MAYVDPSTGSVVQGAQPAWLGLPSLSLAPSAPPPGNWLTSGLSSGFHGMLGDIGAAGQALGTLTGIQPLSDAARGFAQSEQQKAAASDAYLQGRSGWSPGAIGFRVAQALPSLAGFIGAGALVPEAAVPAGLARVGAALPRFIGGGAGLEEAAATAAGRQFGRNVVGATVAGLPLTIGGNVQTAEQAQGGAPISRGQAAGAIALGGLEAPLGGLLPAELRGGEGAAGNGLAVTARNILTGAATGAPTQAGVAAVQQGITGLMDPNKSVGDRARDVVNAAMGGAVVGGVVGGIGGAFHRAAEAPPAELSKEDLTAAVDGPLLRLPPPAPTTLYAGGAGVGQSIGEVDNAARAAAGLPPEAAPPPAAPLGLPAPEAVPQIPSPERMANITQPGASPYSSTPSDQLLGLHQAYLGRDDLSAAEAGQHAVVREELARRTAPGLPLGAGNLFTPEEAAARAPAVDALKTSTLADLPKDVASQPFFQNFNASSEPELVNAIKAQIDTYGRQPKTDISPARKAQKIPDWVQTIANDVGVMDDGKRLFSPAEKLEDLDVDRTQAQTILDAATASNSGKDIRAAVQDLGRTDTEIAKWQGLADLHTQADALRDAATRPAEPAAAPAIPAPDLSIRPRTKPDAFAPGDPKAATKWDSLDALIRGNHADDIKNRALSLQEQIESGTRITQENVARLGIEGRKEQKTYGAGPDRSYVEPPVGEQNAIQEPGATGVDVREQAGNGEGVGIGNAAGTAAEAARTQGWNAETSFEKAAREADQSRPAAEGLTPNTQAPPVTEELPRATRTTVAQKAENLSRLQALHDAETDPARKAIAAKALTDTPAAVRKALTSLETNKNGIARASMEFGRRLMRPPEPSPDITPANWADHVSAQMGGESVVHADADHAVIKTYSESGRPVYLPVSRDSGQLSVRDVRLASLHQLDDATRTKLIRAAERDEAADDRAHAANPEGPFKGATQSVVGTPSVDPRVVGFASNLMRALGMPDVRLLMVHPDDVHGSAGDALGLNGPYQSARTAGTDPNQQGHVRDFGPGFKDFYIYLKPGMSDALTVENIGHEIGHIVKEVMERNAPPEVQRGIDAAFNKFYAKASGATQQEMIQMSRTREFAKFAIDPADRNKPVSEMDAQAREYFLSKDEWFADQVARHVTSSDKPVGIIEKFFKSVADKLRDLVAHVTGRTYLPDPVMRDWLDSLGSSEEMRQTDRAAVGRERVPMGAAAQRTVQESNQDIKGAVNGIEQAAARISQKAKDGKIDLGAAGRRVETAWHSAWGLFQRYGRFLPATKDWSDHLTRAGATTDSKTKAVVAFFRQFSGADSEMRGKVDQYLDDLQKAHGWLDGSKAWNDAFHDGIRETDTKGEWAARHKVLKSEYDSIQNSGGRVALSNMLAMSQFDGYHKLAGLLQVVGERAAARGTPLVGHGVSLDEKFRTNSAAHDSPVLALAHYKDGVGAMMNGIRARINAGTGTPDEIAELSGYLRHADDTVAQIERGTYSPLDHGKGDFYVAAKLIPGHEQAIQNALDKADFHIGVLNSGDETGSQTIMSRVDKDSQMVNLAEMFQQLEKDGHLEPGSTQNGHANQATAMAKMAPKFLASQIESIRDIVSGLPDSVDANTRSMLQGKMISQLMDMLPDNSAFKTLQPRGYISGYDKSMGVAAYNNALNGARASTAASMSGDLARVMQMINSQVQEAKNDPNLKPAQRTIAQDVAREIVLRQAQQAWHTPHGFLDTMQALMHTIMIGANPAYLITVHSQIPILLHGELAKKYGYAKSFTAIVKAAVPAFKIMKAVAQSPDWRTFGIREDALRKAGIPEDQIKVVMALVNGGGMNNYTSEQTNLGEGASERMENIRNVANALGIYGEQNVRLIAALAAKDLYDQRPVANMTRDQYVSHIVDESQFRWGPGQSSRATGRNGVLGGYSRIALAFTNFHTKMLEKTYSEVHDLFGANGPTAQKEAGAFLATHLIAVTAIAGSLGLPFATSAAGAADKVLDKLTGQDDWDVQGLYRTWLAHTFGFEASDVISKGLPRALGMDLSKLGDENLLPLTNIIADKRKWEDASKDWFKQMSGSAAGEVGNLYLGYRDIMNGDYLRGATRILPEGLKGLAEAAYYQQHGVTNSAGQREFTPGARDILMAAVGIDPADIAQYQEAQRERSGLVAEQQYREQNISQHLMKAVLNPGSADLGRWIQAGIKYKLDHLGQAGPLDDLQRALTQHALSGAYAGAFNTPIGVQPLNLNAQRSLGFVHPNPQ